MTISIFKGNCPRTVSKDAKYRIRHGSSTQEHGLIVSLIYESEDDERWHPATDKHPKLVEMVNTVKTEHGEGPNGAFYINEYKQVIVPVTGSPEYYLAGTYETPLEFEFEGKIISGAAVDLEGNPVLPGHKWMGSHHGIRYKLCAGGKDIAYTLVLRQGVTKTIKLSAVIDPKKAASVALMIVSVKGTEGGRFYVNEYLNVFAPHTEGSYTEYYYCGRINLEDWFPNPHAK